MVLVRRPFFNFVSIVCFADILLSITFSTGGGFVRVDLVEIDPLDLGRAIFFLLLGLLFDGVDFFDDAGVR